MEGVVDDAELGFVETRLDTRGDDLAKTVGDFADCRGNHFVNFGSGENVACSEVLDKGPFDDGEGGEDCVVKKFVDDVDCDTWLVGPVFHDRGDNLVTRTGGLGADC